MSEEVTLAPPPPRGYQPSAGIRWCEYPGRNLFANVVTFSVPEWEDVEPIWFPKDQGSADGSA